MKTSSIAVETSRSTTQSDSIVRQTNKRSSYPNRKWSGVKVQDHNDRRGPQYVMLISWQNVRNSKFGFWWNLNFWRPYYFSWVCFSSLSSLSVLALVKFQYKTTRYDVNKTNLLKILFSLAFSSMCSDTSNAARLLYPNLSLRMWLASPVPQPISSILRFRFDSSAWNSDANLSKISAQKMWPT